MGERRVRRRVAAGAQRRQPATLTVNGRPAHLIPPPNRHNGLALEHGHVRIGDSAPGPVPVRRPLGSDHRKQMHNAYRPPPEQPPVPSPSRPFSTRQRNPQPNSQSSTPTFITIIGAAAPSMRRQSNQNLKFISTLISAAERRGAGERGMSLRLPYELGLAAGSGFDPVCSKAVERCYLVPELKLSPGSGAGAQSLQIFVLHSWSLSRSAGGSKIGYVDSAVRRRRPGWRGVRRFLRISTG